MKKTRHISFYCVDNDVLALDEFRKNFKPNYENHTLYTFDSVQKFLIKLENDPKINLKIVFIDNIIISKGMNTKTALELIMPIKNIDKDIEIVIFADSDNIDLKATASDFRVSAFITKDSQFYIKIIPLVSRLISGYELKKKTHSLKKSATIIIVLVSFLIVILALAFVFFD